VAGGAADRQSTSRAAALVHHPRRHAVVGEAEAPGFPGIDRLAGQHHVERRLRADPLGSRSMPPQPGTMPSMTSGKPIRVAGSSTASR
jgi:hypothetical protein